MRHRRVVVTGGCGYVGSVVAHRLAEEGAEVLIVDSLVHGHIEAAGALPLAHLDVRNTDEMARVLREFRADSVCHLAALASVPESFEHPAEYEDVNVRGTRSLVDAMCASGVRHVVFASTCAIYDAPADAAHRLREGAPERPSSPYAASKHAAEQVLRNAGPAGISALALRLFNVAGADLAAGLGEAHEPETHVVPRLVRWAAGRGHFEIRGSDHETPDGTCVRDYVHLSMSHAPTSRGCA